MKSIRNMFKTGIGPSSSHTMGPAFAANAFIQKYPNCDFIEVILFGSLAKTGKGHGTDRAVLSALSDVKTELIFNTEECNLKHPNTISFKGY